MPFQFKRTTQKVKCVYKTIYLSQNLAMEIHQIAADNETSFNNVVISMLDDCLNREFRTPRIGATNHDR